MTCLCRYQGVNWQDKAQWHCNSDESPYKESHYDGINVDPLEVLFVKVGAVQTAEQPQQLARRNTSGAACASLPRSRVHAPTFSSCRHMHAGEGAAAGATLWRNAEGREV